MNGFFPNPAFGWAFAVALLAILVTASYFDLRYFIIPNRLTIPALVAGFVVNIIREGWLGAQKPDETLGGAASGLLSEAAFWGALSGLKFALLGFLLGFGLFLFFWLIRLCAGGDVKLFAAVASWLGWNCSFWVWLLSFVIVATMLTVRSLTRAFSAAKAKQPPDADPFVPGVKGRKGWLPYTVPLTVAVVLVFLWLFIRSERKSREAAGIIEYPSPERSVPLSAASVAGAYG